MSKYDERLADYVVIYALLWVWALLWFPLAWFAGRRP
jgi:hypothetical protein